MKCSLSLVAALANIAIALAVVIEDDKPSKNLRVLQGQGNGNNPFADGGNGNNNSDNGEKVTVILTFTKDVTGGHAGMKAKCDAVSKKSGGATERAYGTVLNGCSTTIPRAAMAALANDPEVARVEEDQEVHAAGVCEPNSVDGTCVDFAPVWGQDRIDQCDLPLDGSPFVKQPATDVTIYVVDTGIRVGHNEFNGMINDAANCHQDFTNEGNALYDGGGHG